MKSMAEDSGYKGINLLSGDSMTVQFDASSGESTLAISGFEGALDNL